MTDFIYSRVSTLGQSTDPQLLPLVQRFPEARVVSEVVSGIKARPLLNALVRELKKNDRLIVYSLDRLGRRALDLLQLMDTLDQKGVVFLSIREGVDYSTISGRLVTQVLASVAEMERNLISERTKAGLAAATKKGRTGGRPAIISNDIKKTATNLVLEHGVSIRKAAKKTGMSAWYLSKLVRDSKAKALSQCRGVLDRI